ncbi:hypothetical protein KUTeg_013430 [Tegillarca granosa]|uniref:C2HC/C3H-type domain-containing protein n=1 Tax=Tegillarca granosa TaxID=220873 RepID=A0ABQ9ETN4_TEGGR|nr:hypothetical protein KUTeg_013430 [Tegillarca granosa]
MTEPSNYNRGPSKIPKFNPATHQHIQNIDNDYQKPSRLQQLQADYQQKLMREKQQKLLQMYEDNQQRTMNRLQSKGLVRDFFNERRTLESNLNQQGMKQMPSINQHYKQRKLHQPENFNEQWVRRPNQRQNSYSKMYTQRHGRPWTKASQKTENNYNDEYTPKSAPVIQTRHSPAESNDSTPPPNLAQIKSLQKQKIHLKRQKTMENKSGRPPKPPVQQKMTDFQKWQMEQDNARTERLKQLHGNENEDFENTEDSGLDSDEKDELQAEIERKQKELMAKIAEQEAELERIRRERQEEEEEYNPPDNRSRSNYNKPENSSRSQYNRANNNSRTQNNRVEPTPPPQPKPVKVVRKQPQRQSPPILDYNNSHPNQKLNTDTSVYDQAALDPDAYPDSRINLAPCPNCGRKFDSERLRKHRAACGNVTKKRKVMDPSKMRVQGTDFEKYQNSRKREEPKLTEKFSSYYHNIQIDMLCKFITCSFKYNWG